MAYDSRRQTGGETSWDLAIQLSEKVCTGEGEFLVGSVGSTDETEQVLSTVAHEMCHCEYLPHPLNDQAKASGMLGD